jgi:hypothetical protein
MKSLTNSSRFTSQRFQMAIDSSSTMSVNASALHRAYPQKSEHVQHFPQARKGTMHNTGSPSGARGVDQLATRERQAGPYGVTGRLVIPLKPAVFPGAPSPPYTLFSGTHGRPLRSPATGPVSPALANNAERRNPDIPLASSDRSQCARSLLGCSELSSRL